MIPKFPSVVEMMGFVLILATIIDLLLSGFLFLIIKFAAKKNISFVKLLLGGIIAIIISGIICYLLYKFSIPKRFSPEMSFQDMLRVVRRARTVRQIMIILPLALTPLGVFASLIVQLMKGNKTGQPA